MYVHHKGQFLDLNGRMGIKVGLVDTHNISSILCACNVTYICLQVNAKHQDPNAAELAACENAGPVTEIPGEWIQVQRVCSLRHLHVRGCNRGKGKL